MATHAGAPPDIAKTNPPVELAIAETLPDVPKRSPANAAIESWPEILSFVLVAFVDVELEETRVDGVAAPIGVFSIEPPETVRLLATCASVAEPTRSEKLMPRVEVAKAVTFAVPPVLFPRMVLAPICAIFVNATPLVARDKVELAPPTNAPMVPVVVNSTDGAKVVVATEESAFVPLP